ncbi:hypothetical protein VCJ71_11085 [Alteriqipengyuania sp. WL0013]|uniref:hypothetical protein n=1 Tax=Alteriqipengyuania sp. WL0013 TaxID=3110773 RepID=UPI002BC1F352|nr:hypothetical protein [Alteriqipengyuania sp. WL0013]MEB3416613.1 hypothetical protein [Alteriqipengyuania sp. WL0013]
MMSEDGAEPEQYASRRILAGVALALFGPALVLGAFMAISPASGEVAVDLPWCVLLVISLVPGLVGIEMMPVWRTTKAILMAIYVPLASAGVLFGLIWAACTFYKECL